MCDNHWDAALIKTNRVANTLPPAPFFHVDEYCTDMCHFHYCESLFILTIWLKHTQAWSHLDAYQNTAQNMLQQKQMASAV